MLFTVPAADRTTVITDCPAQHPNCRIRELIDRFTASPAAAAVPVAVAPGTATPSFCRVAVMAPAAVGRTVMLTSTS